MLIVRVVMSVVMIIAIMTVVPVLRGTCDVNVSPPVVSRLMRSHPVRVSKSIAHKKKWYQQNCYKPVHSSNPIYSNLVRKCQFVHEIARLSRRFSITHHPNFGKQLKKAMDDLGIEDVFSVSFKARSAFSPI
jgi:hypothetical protein